MAITFDPSAMIVLDAALEVPLFRQIYEQIRGHVLAKRLLPGRRLPSTRVLAARLGVSRTSVSAAYEQLMAEGYLEGRAGSGTFVSAHLPDDLAGHIARPGGVPTGSQTPLPTGEKFLLPRGKTWRRVWQIYVSFRLLFGRACYGEVGGDLRRILPPAMTRPDMATYGRLLPITYRVSAA
jgi:DNA-binding transcriptional regulator YhcF (GntR family)